MTNNTTLLQEIGNLLTSSGSVAMIVQDVTQLLTGCVNDITTIINIIHSMTRMNIVANYTNPPTNR